MWFCQVFWFLPLVLIGGWGIGVDEQVVSFVLEGECDIVSIGWTGVNMICGARVGWGGSRYHTRMPKVNLGRFRVDMISLLTIIEGRNKKGILFMRNEPQ